MTSETPVTVKSVRVRPAGYSVVKAGPRGRFLLHRRASLVAAALLVLLAAVCVAYLCVGRAS